MPYATLVSADMAVIGVIALLYILLFAGRRYQESARQRHNASPATARGSDAAEKKGPGDDSDPNKDRKPGAWVPVSFEYPSITPVTEELRDIPPRPYRPFKAGPYHVTMGIRSMPWDEWIELDSEFVKFYGIRKERLRTRAEQLVQVLPNDRPHLVAGGAAAAAELVQELAAFLVRRYPKVYRVERAPETDSGRGGPAEIKKITILPVGETYDLESEDPMTVSAMLVQDDLAIMVEGTDGQYYLQAGAIVLPGSWRLADKIGMPLDEIHVSGEVPSYREKLQPSLTRFFRRLAPRGPVVRENWLVQILDPARLAQARTVRDREELAWSTTMYGREDDFAHAPSSYALSRLTASRSSAIPPPATRRGLPPVAPATLRLRTERQTLRRLPRTGAVVFTIRTYATPLEQLAHEPGVPGRLAGAVRGMAAESARRRRQDVYGGPLLGYLDECHRAQVERGVVPAE